jgi:predicted dehydrogenase
MKPFPIGIVGLNFGKHIIEYLSRPENRRFFQVAAVCDLDQTKAQAFGRKLRVKAYTSLDALLAEADLRQIFEAGRDAVTTKPFETDIAAAEGILQEARRRKRVLHLNSPAPHLSSDMEQIARWRERYQLGQPVGARGEIWVSYREKADGSWYDDPTRCPVAPIFRLGIYLVNDLVELLGSVDEVQVLESRVFTKRPTPDNAQLGIRFSNGALASIYASFCVDDAQSYRNSLTLNFERGTIYRNVGPSLGRSRDQAVQLMLATKGKSGRRIVVRQETPFGTGGYQWDLFYRALRKREIPSPAFARHIIDGLRVISAMKRAKEESVPIKVSK